MSQLFKNIKTLPVSVHIGILILLINIFVAVLAPVIAPYSETEIVNEVWLSPSSDNLLGTDHLGRDLLTRLIYGARNTISIALVATIVSFTLGSVMGLISATMGGWVDQIMSRIVDIIMAFPGLIMALIVLSLLGTSIPVLIMVIAVFDSTRIFRLSRAVAMDIRVMDYIEVARLRGEKLWWVIRREILPNALPPLIAEFGLRFCFVFLFIAGMSFLGLGIQAPMADWGGMVRENSGAITYGIMVPMYPAAAIAILTIGINLIVDWFLRRAAELRH